MHCPPSAISRDVCASIRPPIQAYRDLEAEGFVEMRQGAGTFVREVIPERRASERTRQASGLVRQLVAEAGRLGISSKELLQAIAQELEVKVS